MKNVGGSWQKENPVDLSRWLYRNDGEEAVVVDDATKTYYCGRPEMVETYKAAWAAERKKGDNRKAAMFIDLDRQLFEQESKEEVMSTEATLPFTPTAQPGETTATDGGTNLAPPYHPPQIDMIPVESSNIESVGHDGAETLRIRFKGSATRPATDYDYPGASEQDFFGIINAESVGRAYQAFKGKGIKGIKLAMV